MINNYGLRILNPKNVFNFENSNLKPIQEDILWDGGNFVKLNGTNMKGMLIGSIEDDMDYYWILIDSNLNVVFSSCVGGYDIIDYPEEFPELYVLQYLSSRDTNGLVERVVQKLKRMGTSERLISDLFFKTER